MKIAIFSIGNEVIEGDTINTNSAYLSRRLYDYGHDILCHVVLKDNKKDILESLKFYSKKVDLIITTGGLGPTADDATKEVVSEFLDLKLIQNKSILKDLKDKFKKYNVQMTDNNIKQSYVPEGARILHNKRGTAPGYIIENNLCNFILLPGPPRELNPMFEKHLEEYFRDKSNLFKYRKTFIVSGIGESSTEDKIKDLIKKYKEVYIATYATIGMIKVKVSTYAKNSEIAEEKTAGVVDEIRKRLKEYIISEKDEPLNVTVCNELIKRNISIATAESCTGGLISSKIVENPGVSSIFYGGLITYSNELKINLLNVNKQTLIDYGAVCEQTCTEMLDGLFKKLNSDISIAVTGIAGPTGGTAEKPVGLVYIGLKYFDEYIINKYNFRGDRTEIRKRTAIKVFELIARKLFIDN